MSGSRPTDVVIATGAFHAPNVPEFAANLDPRIVHIHAEGYRNGSELQDGPVLVVGAGNSGADVALDLAAEREVWLSGRHPGHIPFNTGGVSGPIGMPGTRSLSYRVLWTW